MSQIWLNNNNPVSLVSFPKKCLFRREVKAELLWHLWGNLRGTNGSNLYMPSRGTHNMSSCMYIDLMHRLSRPSVKNIFLIHITIVVQKQLQRCCPWSIESNGFRAFGSALLAGLRLQRISAELVEDLKDLTISGQSLEVSHLDAKPCVQSRTRLLCRKSELPLSSILRKICSMNTSTVQNFLRLSCINPAFKASLRQQHLSRLSSVPWSWWSAIPHLGRSLTTRSTNIYHVYRVQLSLEQRFAETGQRSSVSVKHCFWSMNPWWVVASSWTVATSFARFQLSTFSMLMDMFHLYRSRSPYQLLEHVNKMSGRPVQMPRVLMDVSKNRIQSLGRLCGKIQSLRFNLAWKQDQNLRARQEQAQGRSFCSWYTSQSPWAGWTLYSTMHSFKTC